MVGWDGIGGGRCLLSRGGGGIGECERGGVGYAFCFFQHSILLIFLFRCDNTKHIAPAP